MRTQLSLLLICGALAACARVEAVSAPVEVDMANVDLRLTSDITLHVKEMRGRFIPVKGDAPYLDDKRSYAVQVDTGEIAIDLASLNALMVQSLGGDRSNVERLRVSFKDGELEQKGVIDSKINVPFTVVSEVSATPDGRILVRARSVRGFGMPVRPVMRLFGLELQNLVDTKPGIGVEVHGNDLIVDPAVIIPAPSIRGRLTQVRIENDRLVQRFGAAHGYIPASSTLARSHIYWRGGRLAFGKLTMSDTDLELADSDPKDPFDFSLDHWKVQLVAGYSKTLPNNGLKVYMPDYGDVTRSTAAQASR